MVNWDSRRGSFSQPSRGIGKQGDVHRIICTKQILLRWQLDDILSTASRAIRRFRPFWAVSCCTAASRPIGHGRNMIGGTHELHVRIWPGRGSGRTIGHAASGSGVGGHHRHTGRDGIIEKVV